MSADQFGAANVMMGTHLILNGKDYLAWRTRTTKEIELSWNCPKVLEPIPENESAEDKAAREVEECKAAGLLFTRLGDNAVILVRAYSTVREILEELDANYNEANTSNALTIQMQLDTM